MSEPIVDKMDELLKKYGLSAYKNELIKAVLPAIGFYYDYGASELGLSKLGGKAFVPNDFEWPKRNDRFNDFLLQIDLSDVSQIPVSKLLPSHGLLSFFYDLDNMPFGDDPADFNVFYFPNLDILGEKENPNIEFQIKEIPLKFFPLKTVPCYGSRAGDKLEEKFREEKKWDEYLDFSYEYPASFCPVESPYIHQLLGHSANVQGDMQEEAQLITNGVDVTECNNPKIEHLKDGIKDWLLLLQLDMSDFFGFGCSIYYWIRKQDLAAQNFDKVWMTPQCD